MPDPAHWDSWAVPEAVRKMVRSGEIQEWTSRNDECPSFGVETVDRKLVRLFVGHPDPLERMDSGCGERYSVVVQDGPGDDPVEDYSVPTAREAAFLLRMAIEMHDGPRRRLRLLGL
jgi:hypothetical protein